MFVGQFKLLILDLTIVIPNYLKLLDKENSAFRIKNMIKQFKYQKYLSNGQVEQEQSKIQGTKVQIKGDKQL